MRGTYHTSTEALDSEARIIQLRDFSCEGINRYCDRGFVEELHLIALLHNELHHEIDL